MHRGIFKRAGCVLLIVIMCFGLAAPAFASTFIPSRADAIDIGQRINTANKTWAQAYVYYVGGLSTAPNFNLTAEVFDGYFVSDYPTDALSSYVFVSMDHLVKLASRCDFPVSLTYLPTLGIYIIIFDAEFGTSSSEGQREMALTEFRNLTNSALIYQSLPSSSTAVFPYRIVAAFAPNSQEDIPSDLNSSSSGTTDRNYYTNNSSSDTTINVDGSQTVTNIYEGGDTFQTNTFDYSNGTWYDNVSGTINDIETLKYNPVSNTYTVNNTYNISYEYNYTYYYNLGSSENLVQDYKFYYELPDGRSSSDLTADEIAGLSLEFDVVNYAQDRTDENTKVLVPFNGSWADTAYNGPDLRWVRGASITYKESAAFEGALYMDGNTTSAFGFNAIADVSKIPTQGYTIQFRYYADALNQNTSAQYWPLLVAPFGVGQSTTLDFSVVPWFWIGPDGYIYYRAKSGGSLYYNNDNSGATRIGKLTAGSWNDITVSFVPVNSSALSVNFFINGVLQTTRPQFQVTNFDEWARYDKSFYPFFAWNVNSFSFYMASNLDNMFKNLSLGLYEQNGPYQMIDNLRVVDFALYDGSSNFVPTPVPFDTNLVYVLPDTTNLKDNTIAVQSGVPVSGYRIGGVRPTFPDEGMVWMPLENDKIADCQIYNGSYWESVGCRVWTGERWVPAWAFNVITLSDLWDMYGGEDSDNYTEITPGSFYQWFQQQFLELKTTITNGFNGILEALGVEVEGEEDITEPDVDGNADFTLLQLVDRILAGITKVPAEVLSKALGSISETVGGFVTGVTDFFGGVEDMGEQSQPFFESMDGVLGNASQLVHDTWEAVPEDAQNVLSTCFMLAVFGSCIVIFLG